MNAPAGKPEDVVSGPIPPATHRIFFRVFPSVMLPMFLAMSDQTIVASALPAIAGALGEVERVSWIVVAYLLAATISAPLYGYLGDSFGRRRLMFIALGMFTLGAILNSLAPSVTLIAAARFIQGLGGGGLMSMSQALIGEVVPPRQRGQYQGYMAAISVSAAALGPVAGGFLAEHFGWRAVFLVNVPTACIAAVLMLRLAARPGSRKEDWNFDTPGLLLFVCFVVPALLALEQARRLDMTMMPIAAGLLVFSIISLVLLIRRERRAPAPLLPIHLMKQRAIWTAQSMAACHGAALVALIAFTPLYMRIMGIGAPAQVSWALLAVSAAIGVSAMISGRIITRTGYTMILPSIGSTGATIMFVYMAMHAGRQTFRPVHRLPGHHRGLHGHGDGRRAGDDPDGGRPAHAWRGVGLDPVRAQRRRLVRRGAVRRRPVRHRRRERSGRRRAVRRDSPEGPRRRRGARTGAAGGAERAHLARDSRTPSSRSPALRASAPCWRGSTRSAGSDRGTSPDQGADQLAMNTGNCAFDRICDVAPPKIICRRRLWV